LRIWKKALSGAMSAALLASLLGTAFASSAFAATDNTTYLDTCSLDGVTATTCQVVGDGVSRIQVSGQAKVIAAAYAYVELKIVGATFSTVAGQASGFTIVDSTTARRVTPVLDGDYVTVVSPAAVGTATITATEVPAVGIANVEGTFTVDFYAASQLAVSTANTTNVLSVASAAASPATLGVATLTTTVKNSVGASGSPVANATVTYVISPLGTLGAGSVQTITATTNASGVASTTVNSTGVAGTSTITTSVSYQSVTTTLAAKTFSFYGPLAKLTASARVVSTELSGNSDALKVVAEDAAGNKIDGLTVVGVLPSGSVVTTLTAVTATGAGTPTTSYGAGTGAAKVNAVCGATAGKASVQVKYVVSASTTITSNAVDLYCADNVAKSFTIMAGATAVAPGGNTSITVNIKEKNGLPVPDGYEAAVLTNSGAIFGDLTGSAATTYGGDATWTFLAPSTAGIATATAFVSNNAVLANGTLFPTQSVTITIGAVATAGTCTNASALGANATSGFSTATKVAALGTYQTFKISCGAAAAGQTVGILVATKNSAGVWSSFTRLTGRVADASGTAWFNWRSSSATWVSVRGDLGGGLSNAVQARWR